MSALQKKTSHSNQNSRVIKTVPRTVSILYSEYVYSILPAKGHSDNSTSIPPAMTYAPYSITHE